MSTDSSPKRRASEVIDPSLVKKERLQQRTLHATHPHRILEHLVRTVLPERCKNDVVKSFYKAYLENPEATIAECKERLEGWVLEYWQSDKLNNVEQLKKKAVTFFPAHGVIYTIVLSVDNDEEPWRYVGQTENGEKRISGNHLNDAYRRSHISLLHFLWQRAESVNFLLPIKASDLGSGPILNILEQWASLIFFALQPAVLKSNFAAEALRCIKNANLHHGIGIREPMTQGFSWGHYPMMRGDGLQWSPVMLKREFFDWSIH